MNYIHYVLIAFVFILLPISSPGISADVKKRPNLIVIMADDLGYGDLGCYGSKRNKTSHIDQLAAGGLKFTDFHSSGTVCSPTRAGLLTGRYQQRVGVPAVITAKNHRHIGLPLSEVTFAELLNQAGYATGLFGKWHLGYEEQFNPIHQGFDDFRGYVSGNVDYISHIDQTGIADWWNRNQLAPEEGYSTHLINQHSVKFIKKNKNRSFCLYVAHEAPHYPYQGPGDAPLRTIGGKFKIQGERTDIKNAYQEMLQAVDDGVGQIIKTLRELNLEENTLVWFFSDNGANRQGSNGILRGLKGSVWEGGHRVPAVAYWPGKISAGTTSDQTAITLDVFPTLLQFAGVDHPPKHSIDGTSLVSLMISRKTLEPRMLYWGHGSQRAMRDGPWKVIAETSSKPNRNRPRLYHLVEDLSEKNNLAASQPTRLKKMLRFIATWEKEVGPSAFGN